MPTTRMTFDGRIVHGNGEPAGTVESGDDPHLLPLRPFIEACAAIVPADTLRGNVRLGLFVFQLGAADHLWTRHGLDDRRFPALAESLLRHHGVEPAAAMSIAGALPQLREVPIARAMLAEGARTMRDWLDSHDTDCVMRLPELLTDWQSLRLPPL